MSRLSCSAALLSLLAACPDNLPGEVVGAYRLTMHVEQNSCGERGLPLPEGHKYSVELRADEPRGYWRIAGSPPIEGRYQRGEFEFAFAMTLDLGNLDAGTSGCLVRREERLSGRVDEAELAAVDGRGDGGRDGGSREADAAPPLRAEHRIGFTPDPNGRCANVRGPVHVFDQLPCSATYRVDGVATKPF
jgi:hypothetical protein